MEPYKQKAVSDQFLHVANEAHRYVLEVRGKVKSNNAYETIHDEHLAKFYVYNYLHDRPFLASRALLLAELRSLITSPFAAPREAFDGLRFEQYRQSWLASILKKFDV